MWIHGEMVFTDVCMKNPTDCNNGAEGKQAGASRQDREVCLNCLPGPVHMQVLGYQEFDHY